MDSAISFAPAFLVFPHMNRIGFLRPFGLILAALVLPAASQEVAPDTSSLRITLHPYETAYLQDEPIYLKATFTNLSHDSARIPAQLFEITGNDIFYFEILNEKGDKVGGTRLGFLDLRPVPWDTSRELKPRKTYSFRLFLNPSTGFGLTWGQPGVYTVKAHYESGKAASSYVTALSANAEPRTLMIRNPDGSEIQPHLLYKVIADVNTPNLQIRKEACKALLRQYPNSRYAKYALLQLAGIEEYEKRPYPPENYKTALQLYKKATDRYQPFGGTADAIRAISWLFIKTDRFDEAERYLERAQKSPALLDGDRMELEGYLQDLKNGSYRIAYPR